jgi:hypothetical protein
MLTNQCPAVVSANCQPVFLETSGTSTVDFALLSGLSAQDQQRNLQPQFSDDDIRKNHGNRYLHKINLLFIQIIFCKKFFR